MTDALLSVSDVSVRFRVGRRVLTAVDRVSLDVGQGQTVGLVGESGSGKTTLGLAVVRALEPDSGSIVFDGHDVTHMSDKALRPLRSRMQMIFQDPFASLDPKMKVGKIISEPLTVAAGMSRADARQRTLELLEAVGLTARSADRYPSQFSGGQRQRISIARALALSPDFLVADEPVSALDVSIQAQIVQLLDQIRDDFGLTTLVIAHDLALVYQITDVIAVMYLGRIVEQGPTNQVVFDPQHPYTSALLSATPVPDPDIEQRRERIVLHGDPPSPMAPPTGCRFHTRCPIAQDVCASEPPVLEEKEPGHWTACHFPGGLGSAFDPEGFDAQ